MDELEALLANLPGYELITPLMKQRALNGSLIPDGAGVWPGQPLYVTTYDPYYAAVTLIAFLQAQPVVRQVSSEGSSLAVDAPQWSGIIQSYSSLSFILSRQNSLLTPIAIPMDSHVVKLNMEGGDLRYGDIDTDAG